MKKRLIKAIICIVLFFELLQPFFLHSESNAENSYYTAMTDDNSFEDDNITHRN